MSNTKKVLSIVMAVIMALSVFSICAFAATETATWSLSVSSTTAAINDVITVSVAVSTDYYMATTGIPVFYNKTAFEYVAGSATLTDIFGAGATSKTVSNNAAAYPATINSTTYGVLYALYVPLSNQPGVAAHKYAASTTILTFQLKAIANVTNAQIFLSADAKKTDTNIGGNFFSGSYPTSDVTGEVTTVGQIFTLTNAAKTVTIGSSSDPVLSSLSTGVVDSTNHYVYGVPAGTAATVAAFSAYFSVANGSFTISGNGTGATLTVKTTGGATYATYTLVIFGDVNGNGAATADDYILLKASLQGTALTGAYLLAANVNGNGTVAAPIVTADDYIILKAGLQGSGISVNPYA